MNLEIKFESIGFGRSGRNTDGWIHLKTVPYLIVAWMDIGHYDIAFRNEPFHILKTGEAFVAPPNTPLRIRHKCDPASGTLQMQWIHIAVNPAAAAQIQFPFRLSRRDTAEVSGLVREIRSAEEKHDPLHLQIIRQRVSLQVLELLLKKSKRIAGNANPDLTEIYPALHKIEKDCTEELSVGEMAEICSMSESSFYRKFKAVMQESPAEFLLKRRICMAEELFLSSRAHSVKEAAAACGFKNEFHFSRCFRKITGHAPSEHLFSKKSTKRLEKKK